MAVLYNSIYHIQCAQFSAPLQYPKPEPEPEFFEICFLAENSLE